MKGLHILSLILGLCSATFAQAITAYEAARNGNLEALRHLRFNGEDLFIADENGFIPYELVALHADPDKPEVLKRHVEIMFWLKEFHPEKHRYGKASIAFVQASLNALGYRSGAPNGVLNEQTIKAIRNYQRDNNVAETGQLGPQWLGMLYQDSIKDMQYKLTQLGFNTYGSDGMMGAKTLKALSQFRQKNALTNPAYPDLESQLITRVNTLFTQQAGERQRETEKKTQQANIEKIRYIQAGLSTTGYRVGRIDGMLGSKTINAIKSFQRKNSLTATGEIDEKTVAQMTVSFLKDTQRKLSALGYAVGSADGKLGKRTIAALRKYRKKQGLSERGGVDADLLSRLQRSYTTAANQHSKSTTGQTASTSLPSSQVRFAQAGLRTLGHRIDVDGVMGSNTQKAIQGFQQRYKLKKTGNIDDATYKKMAIIFLKETQRKLNVLGYKTGTPDGVMGKRSSQAIRAFRKKAHLTGSGLTADFIAAVDDVYDGRRAISSSSKSTASSQLTSSTANSTTNNSTSTKVTTSSLGGRSAKGRMSFNRKNGRVVGCRIAGRNIPIEWCEPFYPLPKNNHCEASFKPNSDAVLNLWCK